MTRRAPIAAAVTVTWLAALPACGSGRDGSDVPAPIIPAPARVEMRTGHYRLGDDARIVAADPRAQPVARYLQSLLAETRGLSLGFEAAAGSAGEIRLELDRSPRGPPEAYSLEVTGDGIVISAGNPHGLFYGAVTLWQLATADGIDRGPANIPQLAIADHPRFSWRGFMLDSARHYQSPAFIRNLIDWMALHKLNVLHWHLTDDQGWRLEIRKYPELTRTGAWRKPAGAGDPPAYGGYYTQDEVRELVAYAASRYITIVPEIEMPGHAQAAIASYPRLGTGGTPPVSPDWGVHDWLYNADEPTLAFLEDVLTEVIELFPGEFVHIGGDEAVKDRWRDSARVQARIRELGLADETALQGWFVARIGRFLDARGRRLIGWDEILESGIPPRAAIMSWRGTQGAIDAARAGHDVVMAPAPTLYLDYLQSDSPREPPGRPSAVTLRDVYEFEPVPAELAPPETARILGAQLNAWTEHMRLPERIEHQAFPRMAALAEIAWSPAAARDWTGFQERLGAQFARYRALGIDYADTAFEPRMQLAAGDAPGTYRVALTKQAGVGKIHFGFERNGKPGKLRPYRGPFDAGAGDVLGAMTLFGEHSLSDLWTVRFGKEDLARRTDEELKPCSGNLVLRLEDDAPLEGERAVFNVDIVDPCWLWPDVDLSRGATLSASVGQVPFNFQIGKDALAIRHGDARTPDGELVLLDGDCRGAPLAVLPLAAAARNPAVSEIGPAAIAPRPGRGSLCLRFARPGIDPIWAIQWVEIRP